MAESKKNTPVLPKKKDIEQSVELSDADKRTAEQAAFAEQEKYFEVFFHDKTHDTDLDYIPLGVNGEIMQVMKGSTVILPQRFLEVADHAVIDQVRKGRKIASIGRAPYRTIKESTREEFLAMKNKGTKIHKEAIKAREKAVASEGE